MHATKVKVSVTLSRDLLEDLDREVAEVGGGASRSSILDARLRSASRARARDRLAESTARYYRTRSPEQRADDQAWTDVATNEYERSSRRGR